MVDPFGTCSPAVGVGAGDEAEPEVDVGLLGLDLEAEPLEQLGGRLDAHRLHARAPRRARGPGRPTKDTVSPR